MTPTDVQRDVLAALVGSDGLLPILALGPRSGAIARALAGRGWATVADGVVTITDEGRAVVARCAPIAPVEAHLAELPAVKRPDRRKQVAGSPEKPRRGIPRTRGTGPDWQAARDLKRIEEAEDPERSERYQAVRNAQRKRAAQARKFRGI